MMSKRTIFTTVTPIPSRVSRETVMETLHDHLEMIDLNPSHEERHIIKPPPEATPEEYHCTWYQITDKVSYLPAGMYTGKVSFKACFHDLSNGLQTHVYAPMGLDIKEKWTLGGSLPGEPIQPVEIGVGVPVSGLYLREDVEIRCNFLMTKFIKKTLKDSLATLVARLLVKSELQEAVASNKRLTFDPNTPFAPPLSPQHPPMSPAPLSGGLDMQFPRFSPQMAPAQFGGQYPNQASGHMQGQMQGQGPYKQEAGQYPQNSQYAYQQQPAAIEMDSSQQPDGLPGHGHVVELP